ncbi:hypothetical protein CHISP_0586 [Chitinispirillum alkaliphilum]|nr:hypothetical protein CHISP_0586 [Chitinispirillum alkaliphilum]
MRRGECRVSGVRKGQRGNMNQNALNSFGAYRKSIELFDLVVSDMGQLSKNFMCNRLVVQQIASADSIASNIEDGYGRLSRVEYRRFLDFARGSARETWGRYGRMKHWISTEIIGQRQGLLDEIIGILSATITTLGR